MLNYKKSNNIIPAIYLFFIRTGHYITDFFSVSLQKSMQTEASFLGI